MLAKHYVYQWQASCNLPNISLPFSLAIHHDAVGSECSVWRMKSINK